MKQRLPASAVAALVLLGFISGSTVFGLASSVDAHQGYIDHGFGVHASPNHYYADSSYHNWRNSEGNQQDSDAMDPVFDGVMWNEYIDKTDLSGGKTTTHCNSSWCVDVSWWMNTLTTANASATCDKWISGHVGTKCDHVHVIFDRGIQWTSLDNQKQGACHEIGHSVGFDDSLPTPGSGCMSGGGLGQLNGHEVHHIDAGY